MLLSFLFGKLLSCRHPRVTFPIKREGTYEPRVACLDCGREFRYDWDKMRVSVEVRQSAKGVRA